MNDITQLLTALRKNAADRAVEYAAEFIGAPESSEMSRMCGYCVGAREVIDRLSPVIEKVVGALQLYAEGENAGFPYADEAFADIKRMLEGK